jgi:hypothetical protein
MHEPKGTYRVDDINIVVLPDKLNNPNGMQITCEKAGERIRNLFVHARTGEVSISLNGWCKLLLCLSVCHMPIADNYARFVHVRHQSTSDIGRRGNPNLMCIMSFPFRLRVAYT